MDRQDTHEHMSHFHHMAAAMRSHRELVVRNHMLPVMTAMVRGGRATRTPAFASHARIVAHAAPLYQQIVASIPGGPGALKAHQLSAMAAAGFARNRDVALTPDQEAAVWRGVRDALNSVGPYGRALLQACLSPNQ